MQAVEHNHDHHDHNHATERAQAWVKTLLLLGLGLYFVYNILTGNLANYINARFGWLSYVAATLFLLLGGISLWGIWHEKHEHHHDHDHDHAELSWGVLAIIAVPLVIGTLIPSRPLGAAAVDGNISLNSSLSAGTVTTFTGDPLTWNVLDWLRAFNQSDNLASFNGKEADVIGFVYREATFGEDQFMVARFTISCCVADSSAIGLPVVFADAADFPADTWVQIHGTFQVGDFRGDTVPLLYADSIEVIDQPEHPYLYP
ncbi:MAG: TIGR03943 family protein [Anaerolineaceae bacterium]|nr:TIGR03943 family protein [Anaerolineaceae bacterium]